MNVVEEDRVEGFPQSYSRLSVSGIGGALRNAARLTSYDRAVQLGRQRMNELLLDDRLPRESVLTGDFDPQQTGGPPAG